MPIGKVIYHQAVCTNSMQWAKDSLDSVEHGALFTADVHQRTRGRQGRVWHGAPGQLLLTFVLKPEPFLFRLPNALASLFMALSLGFLRPFSSFGIQLKWPNDFVYGHKKMGGMLMECVWQGDMLTGVIVGAGFNINNTFSIDHKLYGQAISLQEISSQRFDLTTLQNEISGSLESFYQIWSNGSYEYLFSEWRKHQKYLGNSLTLHREDGLILKGIMIDLLPDGKIIFQASDKTFTVSFENIIEVTKSE